MTESPYERLLALLDKFAAHKLWYRLDHIRPDSVMVLAATPGVRWGIEVMDDGSIEIERFVSTGTIEGEEALDQFWTLNDV